MIGVIFGILCLISFFVGTITGNAPALGNAVLDGAAGAVEAAFCALSIHDSFVPPTINYETPDPVCDLDYTPNVGVAMPVRAALSTSLGFGGHNGALVFRKV